MTDQEIEQAQEIAKDPKIPPSLVKEAAEELTLKLNKFTALGRSIAALEKDLKAAREQRQKMLRENPWLGNIQGILNKEATKMAQRAYGGPEQEQDPDTPMDDLPDSEKKIPSEDLTPLVPKKSPGPIDPNKTPAAVRARLDKKLNKQKELARIAKSQFPPGHPSHGQ